MANNKGTVAVDFGSAPGKNLATVTVTGQTGITTGSHAEAWLMGDVTSKHNAYEHQMVPLIVRCGVLVAGTGFTIYASSEWLLTGTFNLHWVWTT